MVTSVVCLWPLWCSFNRDNYFKLGHSAVIAAPLHGQTEQLLKWWEQAFAKKDDEIKLEIGKGEGRTSQQSASNSSSRSFSKREASISKISQDWVCILALCWQAEKNWLKAPRNTVLLWCVLCLCMQYCYPEAAACNARKGGSREHLLLVHNTSGQDQQQVLDLTPCCSM